jgi:hypothetical protein
MRIFDTRSQAWGIHITYSVEEMLLSKLWLHLCNQFWIDFFMVLAVTNTKKSMTDFEPFNQPKNPSLFEKYWIRQQFLLSLFWRLQRNFLHKKLAND